MIGIIISNNISIQDRGYLVPDVTHLLSISIGLMLRVVNVWSSLGIITIDLIEGKLACLKTRHTHFAVSRGCMRIP